jgi:large subunit ribosomal protein L3
VVVQAKDDGDRRLSGVQLGFVEETPCEANKAAAGAFKKINVPPTRVRREVKQATGSEPVKAGDQVLVSILPTASGRRHRHQPRQGDFRALCVAITSLAARRRMVRCSIVRQARSARRRFPRASSRGCVAPAAWARTGSTVRNLKVLKVDPENHLLVVEGGIPGAPAGYVMVRKAVAAKKLKVAQVEKPKKAKK